jgi:signal peptidase I
MGRPASLAPALCVSDSEPWQGNPHRAKCELAAEVVRSFGTLRLQVTGCSMLPAVWPGDVLLAQREDIAKISRGDIVLFSRGGQLVAHRVVSTVSGPEGPCLITRGDAQLAPDSPVTAAELLGRVVFILRAGKRIEPPRQLSFPVRLMAKLVSHSGRLAWILVRLHALWLHLAPASADSTLHP